jgi:aspartate kinase
MAGVFGMLDRYRIAVDLVSTSEMAVSVAMEGQVVKEKVMGSVLLELGSLGTVELQKGRSIVSVVGREIKGLRGVSGRMFSTMGRAGVNVEMISQGLNEINISCVVAEDDALSALRAVHRAFFAEEDEGSVCV